MILVPVSPSLNPLSSSALAREILQDPAHRLAHRRSRRGHGRALRAAALALVTLIGVWDARAELPALYRVQRAGLSGAEYGSDFGRDQSTVAGRSSAGLIAGTSERYGASGRAAWIHDPAANVTNRIGLYGGIYSTPYFSGHGGEFSEIDRVTSTGFITGYSDINTIGRSSVTDPDSRHAWLYNANTRSQVTIGLTREQAGNPLGFTGNNPEFVTPSGVVAGYRGRSFNDGVAWVYDPIDNTTTRIGLVTNLNLSFNDFQNTSGQVAGYAPATPTGSALNTQRTWVYSHSARSTVRTGLFDDEHTSSTGAQYARNFDQSESGHVVGYSRRYYDAPGSTPQSPPVARQHGQNTWAYLPDTRTTILTGFTSAEYTGSSGYQYSEHSLLSPTGIAAGFSVLVTGLAVDNGRRTWAFDPVSQATTRTGLVGPEYVGAGGYEFGSNLFQNDRGHIVGYTERAPIALGNNARDAWYYNPTTTTSTRIGLTGSVYSTPLGFQFSTADALNSNNQIAGATARFDNATENGRHTWVYDPRTNTTLRTGLTGSDHTTAAGDNYSFNDFQVASGHVAGYTLRLTSAGVENGQNTWLYDPTSQSTITTGLREPIHTGSGGFQSSVTSAHSTTGIVAGYSLRITGIDTTIGQDAWYFDPTTNSVIDITQGVLGNFRSRDNFASSAISILTEDGFAFGTYTYFADNAGNGEDRPFVFRPDIGFNDLTNRIAGGLTAAGWTSLFRVTDYNNSLDVLTGYGRLAGTSSGSRGVYVLVPTPSSAAIVLACVLVPTRRRRRAR